MMMSALSERSWKYCDRSVALARSRDVDSKNQPQIQKKADTCAAAWTVRREADGTKEPRFPELRHL
jgi:hypothetical protein